MSSIINDYRYDGVPCSEHAEKIIRTNLAEKLFICPRCGMVFSINSIHNYGTHCSFCATDEDKLRIEEQKEQMRQQLKELQEEIELKLKK